MVQIATKDLPRYDTKDVDTFYICAESLKAVLWSSWQRTWGSRPPDQSRIKLVHFGQTINDFMLLRCTSSVSDSHTTLANRHINYR